MLVEHSEHLYYFKVQFKWFDDDTCDFTCDNIKLYNNYFTMVQLITSIIINCFSRLARAIKKG